jgi:predicted RNA binding protein YcfA (HicA-like mRNA interferase family)
LYDVCVSSTLVIKLLKAAGWKFLRSKGSHHHFGFGGKFVTVPHPKKDLGTGLVKAIERSTGVKLLP